MWTVIMLGVILLMVVLMVNFGFHEWYLWGQSSAKNGFTAVTAKAGWPDTYTVNGNTLTLRDFRGREPFYLGGLAFGVTKSGGGKFIGNKSYAGVGCYVPSIGEGHQPSELFNYPPKRYQRSEVLTGYLDSANVNEVTGMGLLFGYGGAHVYPRTLLDVVSMLPKTPNVIHSPQFSVTPSGAITAGSGSVTLEAASQEDYWITMGKQYYILGVIPHLVNNNGFLEFSKGLPQDSALLLHKDVIPISLGAPTVTFRGTSTCLPYEPIGPFTMDEQPNVGMFASATSATTFSAIIAEM